MFGQIEVPFFQGADQGDVGGSFFQRHYDPSLDPNADLGLLSMEELPASSQVMQTMTATTNPPPVNPLHVETGPPMLLILVGVLGLIWIVAK